MLSCIAKSSELSERYLTALKLYVIVGCGMSQKITFVKVPLPREVVELARARGVSVEDLAKAAETLLLLEVVSMDSKLEMDDALKIADEVIKKAWERLKGSMQQ